MLVIGNPSKISVFSQVIGKHLLLVKKCFQGSNIRIPNK